MFELFEKIAEGIGFKIVSNFRGKVVEFINSVKKEAYNKDNENKVATSGNRSQVATSGDSSQVATSGNRSQVATSGDSSQVATSGDLSQVATSGNWSKVATSGDRSQVATSGDSSQVATSGDLSKVVTSGNWSKVATSGDWSKVEISGKNSVGFVCGLNSIIKAKKGNWISLCEYVKNDEGIYIPVYAKSAQIGNKEYKDSRGRILKETEFYSLHNKKFYQVDFTDEIQTMIVSEKVRDGITIIKGIDFEKYDEVYIAKEGDLSAHGYTLREAIDDLTFKKMKDIDVEDIVKEIKETGKVTRSQYRAITGACSFGTNQFCKQHGIEDLEEIEIEELRKILVNDYGAKEFWNLIDRKDI